MTRETLLLPILSVNARCSVTPEQQAALQHSDASYELTDMLFMLRKGWQILQPPSFREFPVETVRS